MVSKVWKAVGSDKSDANSEGLAQSSRGRRGDTVKSVTNPQNELDRFQDYLYCITIYS
jgi:hypothetical protein